jgi:outer membrane protein assembly factor BamB
MRRLILAAALLALVAACSKSKDINRPKDLVPFTASVRLTRAWTASVGGTRKPLRLGLDLTLEGDRLYAAGRAGEIAAFDVATGRRLWERRVKAALGGGPGADSDMIVVGSSAGDVFALRAADGGVLWHANIGSEILAAPAVTPRLVVVRAVDGKLHALRSNDGHEIWQVQQPVPSLSLRGTSRPTIVGELAICGFDNGKVVAANLSDGSSAWETQITPPHGTNEIERLNDVDATPRVAGNDVYVAQFQGKVAMLALDSGQIWWSHEMSSYHGMAVDGSEIYVATADGQVIGMRSTTGVELWTQKALMFRSLSMPAVSDSAIAVGDYQGYVHLLDPKTGTVIGRVRAGKHSISSTPVLAGDLLIVMNERGAITAFRMTAIETPRRATKDGAVKGGK